MIPIPTAEERIAIDPKFDVNDVDMRDDIIMQHMAAETVELRSALETRTPQFNLGVDQLAIIRAAKRVMVDTLIGSGLNYQICGEVSALLETMLHDLADVTKG
jgi:hypothetical protein